MDMRKLKSLTIAATARILLDGTSRRVPTQKTASKYRVTLEPEPFCECEDFALRREPCKHILAARIVHARDHGGKATGIGADAVPKKQSGKQIWPLYNLAQQTEKDRFQVLLHDLVRNVEELPRPWTGRRRTPVADMLFASCLKIVTTFSSRRFACGLAGARAQGLLSTRMNSVSVCSSLENELMTPLLQKLVVQSRLALRAGFDRLQHQPLRSLL